MELADLVKWSDALYLHEATAACIRILITGFYTMIQFDEKARSQLCVSRGRARVKKTIERGYRLNNGQLDARRINPSFHTSSLLCFLEINLAPFGPLGPQNACS